MPDPVTMTKPHHNHGAVDDALNAAENDSEESELEADAKNKSGKSKGKRRGRVIADYVNVLVKTWVIGDKLGQRCIADFESGVYKRNLMASSGPKNSPDIKTAIQI